MSVVVVATITPLPEHRDEVIAGLLAAIPKVHLEDGCELYALNQKDDRLIMIERWSSLEALQAHNGGAALAELGTALAGKVAGALDVQVLTALPAGDPAKGAI